MNADGSGVMNLTNSPAWDGEPAWSPNGKKIAFGSDRDDNRGDIFAMDADGSHAINLTQHVELDFHAA